MEVEIAVLPKGYDLIFSSQPNVYVERYAFMDGHKIIAMAW
eukprot:COSAG01_NODE_31664_length_593_cov_1.443320_1_plen_40_part_01